MQIFKTQGDFLSAFPIRDNIINLRGMSVKLLFNLDVTMSVSIANAGNINAYDISTRHINAGNIEYYAVCFAYHSIICKSITGERRNARHFCLDGDITIAV